MEKHTADISGLSKEDVLIALYNNAQPIQMGFLQYDPKPMSQSEAEQIIKRMRKGLSPINDEWHFPVSNGKLYFDYLKGRCMKIDITNDVIFSYAYDQMYGKDAAANVVQNIRASQLVLENSD